MAYPTIDKPYGLKPVNLIGGQVFAGSTRLLKIASGYAANIFYGDVVKMVSTGTIEKDTGTTTVAANGVAGVFLGCTYTNPSTKQPTWSQYWPTGTVASDAQAYVADDPDVLFKVAAVSGTTVVAFYGQATIGNNVSLVQNAGSTTTGDSAIGIDGTSAAATVSLPIRVVAGVPDTANAAGEFCEFICKFNAPYITLTEGTPNVVAWNGGHMYNNPTGI
tara:strand:- start:270 stop:926 length:657 start_codon:yes stop_codon:yes gene_type:complete